MEIIFNENTGSYAFLDVSDGDLFEFTVALGRGS